MFCCINCFEVVVPDAGPWEDKIFEQSPIGTPSNAEAHQNYHSDYEENHVVPFWDYLIGS